MSMSANKTGAESRPRFYIESLGCPKNTVDSTGMALLLQRRGYRSAASPEDADVLIVNTCGFIALARGESLEALEALAEQRRPGQKIVAAGCWAQREPDQLLNWVPEIDGVIGTRTWYALPDFLELLDQRPDERLIYTDDRNMALPEEAGTSGYALSGVSAFLKIADGCSRQCAFCAIPSIKGPTVSRSMDAIIEDAQALQDQGVLEINLIAQDTTHYGYDLGMKDALAALLERLVDEVPDIPWIRVLYAFPGYITPHLIEVFAEQPRVLPYVDIPLQHAHPDVLRRMRRPSNMEEVRQTVANVRDKIPDICLRTTFLVGFPGETDDEFAALLKFVEETRFDRVGVFTYSHEPGTPAAALPDDVPEDVKAARLDALMKTQQPISLEKNRALVGKRLPILLEGAGEGLTIGRSYRDAPEIDGLVLIERDDLRLHRFAQVEITEAMVYDLKGRVVEDN
jgi:ribosomal protein S12 methylthiotransferase